MYVLKYSRAIANDLDTIFNYIAKDSTTNAFQYITDIESTIIKLREFPLIGTLSKYPELKALNIRILPHDKYLIFYRFNQTNVEILRILHGAMNYKNLF